MENRLKEIRKAHRLTQEQLADAIGATKRQVGAWERGENDLPLDYACTIADVLDCSLDSLACHVEYAYMRLETDEEELAEIYRSITPEGQHQLMVYARGIAATYSKGHTSAKAG